HGTQSLVSPRWSPQAGVRTYLINICGLLKKKKKKKKKKTKKKKKKKKKRCFGFSNKKIKKKKS
ncbi:hypothetical protein ACYTX6_09295, partial [Streptococcus pyogenes]